VFAYSPAMARVAFVARCVLHQNSRVAGGAHCRGVYSPFVRELRAAQRAGS